MAVKLNEMAARSKMLVVDWDGETVDVSYFPNVVTPALLDAVAEANDKEALGTLLVPVVDWWDILQDDGVRLPCNQDTIQIIPMSFLNRFQDALNKAQRPPGESSSDAS